MNTITINGEEYVKKSDIQAHEEAETFEGLPYVMVRTYSAGVFAGYLESREGKEVKLRKARRIWRWAGAASLSELATKGTNNPKECKFPCEVESVELIEAIEIIPITKEAQQSIQEVPVWTMN